MSEKKKKSRGKTFSHGNLNKSTQQLYAMAVDKFFKGVKNKDEQFRILSPKEEKELIKRFKNDRDELENQLTMHNIFLAISFASNQQYRYTDFDELISLAMYGLREAATKFDIKKGFRFNTYAVFYIRKHILKKFYVKKETEIEKNTSIFLDSNINTEADDSNGDFSYSVLNSKIEPTIEERISKNSTDYIEEEEKTNRFKSIANQIIQSVETSSLSTLDKKIFNMSFMLRNTITTISRELGVSRREINDSKNRVISYINANFSKKDIFEI